MTVETERDVQTTFNSGERVETETRTVNESSAHLHTSPVRSTLYRHPTNKMLGGVCGGLGDYLGIDATLVRILWIVATLVTSGGGFLAYLALWLFLPVGTVQQGQQRPAAIEFSQRSLDLGAKILIILGGLWLLANLGILPWIWNFSWGIVRLFFWPAILIGVGYLLLRGSGNESWKINWQATRNRWQSKMNSSMPSKTTMKDSLRQVKSRLPLKRSRRDRVILGVCGGIGQRFGLDANLVRLLWGAFSIGSIGMGVLLYVAVGLLLPEENALDITPYSQQAQDVPVVEGSATRVI